MADATRPSPRSRNCSTRTRTATTAPSCSNPPKTASRSGVTHFWAAGPAAIFESRGRTVTITEQDGSRREFEADGDPVPGTADAFSRATVPRRRRTGGARAVRRRGGRVSRVRRGALLRAHRAAARRTDELGLPEMLFLITDTLLDFRSPVPAAARAGQRLHRGPRPRRGLRRGAAESSRGSSAACARRATCGPGVVYEELPPAPAPVEQHHARRIRGDGRARQGIHPRRRHFPVRALATLRDAVRRATRSRSTGRCGSSIRRRTCSCCSSAGGSRWWAVRRRSTSARWTACVEIRPIAGTRRRGATPEEDRALAESLLADPKERAEHLMLVDLARNDVGRIAEFGSVRVTDFMTDRALQPRHAPRLQRGRHAARGPQRVRRDARDVPGRDGQRLAEGARDADHQRTGKEQARLLRAARWGISVSTATWTVASRCARWC